MWGGGRQARVAADFEYEYGALKDLSAMYYKDAYSGIKDTLVLNGYDLIPKGLMTDAQSAGAVLMANFTVTKVKAFSSGTKVNVTGKSSVQANGKDITFTADAAIVTVPLGVLKAGKITFSPGLSDVKKGAISRLGFGYTSKVVLWYTTKFWQGEGGSTTPTGKMPTQQRAMGLYNLTLVDRFAMEDSDVPNSRGRFPFWRNLVHPEGQSALSGTFVGAYADSMSGKTTDKHKDAAVEKIRAAYPDSADPVAAWTYDWYAPLSFPVDSATAKRGGILHSHRFLAVSFCCSLSSATGVPQTLPFLAHKESWDLGFEISPAGSTQYCLVIITLLRSA